MKFGDNLRQIRKNKKISQEQLAEKVNVSRQSVSKWENGESYPEMNHILKLCKIFNCELNNLITDDIKDISLIDDINETKFDKQKQRKIKILSNIICLIGKIGAIVLKVTIPFIILAIILVPYIVNNVEIKNNNIEFKTDNIKIVDENKIKVHDIIIGEFDIEELDYDIIKLFKFNSNTKIIVYIELALIFLLINVIIIIIILNYVEKLFNNIKNNNTPFTLDNATFIKIISYLMIGLIIITPMSEMLFNSLFRITEENSPIDLIDILKILIIFSMSYIFEYGYELQKYSKVSMYNEETADKK